MKNDERRRGFALKRASAAKREERQTARGGKRGRWRSVGRGGTGTAKTVADWRPRARLRILGVMPVIRGFGAQ
ncbi:hypothetical protein ALC60_11356 [Trachymyrmex zeteki]|uniref:Uncharacterized protein n=1 Tax=Mycetomoellerius zeteki TaxID=64791 RepID=A0A151WNU4_9HYME|nr:hypothetical protein ALC60_11356 [Trachymyrmex zeteki]